MARWRIVILAIFSLIAVSRADDYTLRIIEDADNPQQTKIAANFQFYPKIQLEFIEKSTNKRVTGKVTITTDIFPATCLSQDSTFELTDGFGFYPGSVCEPTGVDTILQFKTDYNGKEYKSEATKPFTVTGDIHLAYFSKDIRYKSGYYEQFLREAIDDVNKGHFEHPIRTVFSDRTISLKSYYYNEGRPGDAIKAWEAMEMYHEKNPDKRAHSIIGFSNNDVSRVLLPLTTSSEYAVTSYRDDISNDLGDKSKYPYFNRIHYSEEMVQYSFALYLKERNWKKIVILSNRGYKMTPEFYGYCKTFNISVVKEYTVDSVGDVEKEPAGKFESMLKSIKDSGVHLIVTTTRGDSATYLFIEAMRMNMTAQEHYQWVGYRNAKYFPDTNWPTACRNMDSLCNFRFKGMTFFDATYFVHGWQSPEWLSVLARHHDGDIEKVLGHDLEFRHHDIFNAGPEYGLIYDVLKTEVYAMERLILANKTISGPTLSEEIRKNTDFIGFTDHVKIHSTSGDRMNFIGLCSVNWPNSKYFESKFGSEIASNKKEEWDYTDANVLAVNTLFEVDQIGTTEVKEFKADGGAEARKRIYDFNDMDSLTGYISVPEKYKNKRSFKAYKGLMNLAKQRQIETNFNVNEKNVYISLQLEDSVEYVPAPYYCEQGCGGNVTGSTDINIYEHGTCVQQGVCECIKSAEGVLLWSGPSCDVATCSAGCEKGSCVSPDNCVCLEGWGGEDCSQAICASCTSGGKCVSPDVCVCNPGQFGSGCGSKCTCVNGECNAGLTGDGTCVSCESGYIGANCDVSLAAVCVPTIIGGMALALALYFLAQYFIAQTRLKAALMNNDWIVDWSDLKRHDEATGRSSMFLSAMSMNNTKKERKQVNTGTWQGVEVHYQLLDKDSIVLSDSMRLEVKQMRDMRHINISSFVGACINSPNVSILTELQPKGGLDDVLTNEDIKFPWNFRFAILKGICTGLEYIHKSEIKSHGRLKSSNCLIDNRWTVKLAGFGLHQFKSGQKDVGPFNPHQKGQPDESKSNYGSLIWTAPEILQTGVYHIDHVGRGSVEGDCYSLGLVMSEMCTRDYPFADVMLEKSELIDLLCGKKDDAVLRVWNDYIAKLNIEQGGWVRPCIKDKEWPTKYEKRKNLKKLMESCWHEDPVRRPTISECKSALEVIDPQRGELMDHLVTMLEKYSSNLEDIVAKRTKQLTKEKQKTEDLVSRLLPKSVADDLKQGKRVEPENFDDVTIYFSDIVGFTSIAKASTPLEVVALLNDMYTCFDGISANYDVYKVETIGDAYMIVSGLPTRNGDKHAGEICTTAMDLMHAIGSFKIEHMQDTKMRLRAGIHTGTVVAGVVGLKMPRYCLFGDSVKVAESMESGGSPMRIQISEKTYDVLQRLGGYKCELRHQIEVKGLGMLKTYWLKGKVGYDKKLPDPEPDE